MDGEKILLVDDEEDFVEALSERLEVRGLRVEVASNGAEALEKAAEGKFDAVILDLAMPGMDGVETLRELRKVQPDLQVILLTGHATLQKGIEAMKLGAMDFLEKPADLDLLMEKIRQARSLSEEADARHTQALIDDIIRTRGW